MTNINCSSNCKHQIDGKCTLDNATINSLSAKTDCVFFEEINLKSKIKGNCNKL